MPGPETGSSAIPDLGSRFDIEEHLGSGGMGVVYRAWDRERQGWVALKALRRLDDPSAVLRLKHEFRALADLTHRNLVRLYELIATDDQWFFTMELLDGTTFLRWVRGDQSPAPTRLAGTLLDSTPTGTLPTQDVSTPSGSPPGADYVSSQRIAPPADRGRLADGVLQLVAGLEALHRAGLVHRDVKPSNVMVTPEGRVVLLDFGIIADVARTHRSASERVGTPMYMAPEQDDPHLDVTPAADWYAVGIMLYEALTGVRPFSGAPADVLARKQHLDAPRPSERDPDIEPAIDELCHRLLHRTPNERARAADIRNVFGFAGGSRRSRPSTAPPTNILVGRDPHREWLWDVFGQSTQGGAMALVHGASGMGKSALVRAFLDEVTDRESALVLAGRCYERESVPYKAVDSLVDALARELSERGPPADGRVPRHSASLTRMFPVMRRVSWLAAVGETAEDADLHEIRRRAFRSLRLLLATLAAERPLVLFIDDLQWGDADSAPLLQTLLRPPTPPLLLLGCYRTEEQERSELLRSLRRARHGRRPIAELELTPLTHEQAAELARLLLHSADASTEAADAIATEARGHPYFVRQLVHDWTRREDERHPRVVGLDELIRRRVSELAGDRQRLLELICIAGRPVARSIALAAADLRPSDRDLLEDLASAQLVRLAGGRRSDVVEPWHDRVREAVTDGLDVATRRAHHGRLAGAFESQRPDDFESLAVHHHAAGDLVRAARYAEQAGDQAARALAFDRAVYLYEMALDGITAPTASHALQIRLGEALANAGRGADAAARFVVAAKTADPAAAFELRRRAAFEYLKSGHLGEGLDLLERVLAQIGIKLPRTPRAALWSLLWRRARLALRGYGYRPRDASEVNVQELTRIDTCWAATAGLAIVDSWRSGDFESRQFLRALRAGEPTRVARALAGELFWLSLKGEPNRDKAVKLLAQTRELAQQLDVPALTGFVEFAAGNHHYQLGELTRALEALERALRIFREHCTGVSWEMASAHMYRMWTYLYLGELRSLQQQVHDLIDDAVQRGDRYAAANLRTGLPALVHLMRDDPDALFEDVAAVLAEWSRDGYHLQHYWAMYALATAHLYRGEPREAAALIDRDWKPMRRSLLMRIQTVRGEMLHLRARAAVMTCATGDDPARARRRAARDAAALVRQRGAWIRPFGHLIRAGLAASDDPADAAEQLEAAERMLVEHDLHLHAKIARYQRGRLARDAALVAEVTAWMREQGVLNPDRFAAAFVPLAREPEPG